MACACQGCNTIGCSLSRGANMECPLPLAWSGLGGTSSRNTLLPALMSPWVPLENLRCLLHDNLTCSSEASVCQLYVSPGVLLLKNSVYCCKKPHPVTKKVLHDFFNARQNLAFFVQVHLPFSWPVIKVTTFYFHVNMRITFVGLMVHPQNKIFTPLP